jgi:O-antigen/teichoic acid export membrane protein
METLKEKTTRGLFWGGLNNVVQQGLGLLFGIVLGRLLNRSDYGMVAMIAIFSLVATALQDSGFRSAIANLKAPRHEDYNAVFWFNVAVGAGCYVALFLAAPLIAAFYRTPELVLLCRVAFLSIIFSCLGTAQSAFLFRNLKVKEQAKCNMRPPSCPTSLA